MPDAPEIYGTSIVLDAKPVAGGADVIILAMAYTGDGKVLDAVIYDNTWPVFRAYD